MPKSGQARVPSAEERARLFDAIKKHRHAEKNAAIMQISFKLGLRVQEIALLQLKDVCRLGRARNTPPRDFELYQVMALPAAYTKGADALGRSKKQYERKTVSFSVDNFNKIIQQVEAMAKANAVVDPSLFYPDVKRHRGKSRDLPLVDEELRDALIEHLIVRLSADPGVTPNDPLFINQKGGPYSPNTLQEHMALMLRGWAGIEKASSHSGRRSLITDVIHNQGKSLKVAQKIAGHVNASTTVIYDDPPEEEISNALGGVFK